MTPDGRYIAVRGRLWRRADPLLPPERRAALVSELMAARQAVRAALHGTGVLAEARARVDAAKRGLGERGDVWWTDGAPDLTRHMARLTSYASWFAALPDAAAAYGARGPGRRRTGAAACQPASDEAPDALTPHRTHRRRHPPSGHSGCVLIPSRARICPWPTQASIGHAVLSPNREHI